MMEVVTSDTASLHYIYLFNPLRHNDGNDKHECAYKRIWMQFIE